MRALQFGSAICFATVVMSTPLGRRLQDAPSIHTSLHGRIESLIIGGGPTKKSNQAGIESNVRYVSQLLPMESQRRVLFADGDRKSKSVFCEGDASDYFREPRLPRIDGPATNDAVKLEISSLATDLAAQPGMPALLYFTGHGGGDREGDYQDNYYCTWKDDQLPVTELAGAIAGIPKTSPIVLVMVECFSGGFGNLLFQSGQPNAKLLDRPICGFFAATAERMSAGCTPEINEADYKDFTGYFFAALTGVDRMGRAISGADYNHDGKVTMDEAFAYTLIHDESIDTPVCTSDVYLRKYVKTPEKDCFKANYEDVTSWATPAQKAALDALRSRLDLPSQGDMTAAYAQLRRSDPDSESSNFVHLLRFCRLFKTVVLTHELRNSADRPTKQHFEALIRLEHTNPLSDSPMTTVSRSSSSKSL